MPDSKVNRAQIIHAFPKLAADADFRISDWPNPNFNCIAYAACVTNEWWEPLPLDQRPTMGLDGVTYNWPYDAPFNSKLDSYIHVFKHKNYVICNDGLYEKGFRKICIYGADKDNVSHASRQRVVDPKIGIWVSKLGQAFTITHGDPYSLESNAYGIVLQFMKCKWS